MSWSGRRVLLTGGGGFLGSHLKERIEHYHEYLRPIRLEDPVWLFHIAAWPPER